MQTKPQYEQLHASYVRSTGLILPLTMPRIYCWEAFSAQGFTCDDVSMVVAHLKRKIKEGRKWPSCLSFSNLIRNTDEFGEELAEARALARAPKPHPAHRELAATGRPTVKPTTPARSVSDILAAEQAFAQFRALKDTL